MRETKNKTITVARRDDSRKREIKYRPSCGWLLPPEETGPTGEGYVDGHKAYEECVRRWVENGWTVQREPNPNYRAPDPLRGLFKLF